MIDTSAVRKGNDYAKHESAEKRWTPASLACALAMMAILAVAPAWAYTATVRNKTEHTVKVVVFEMRFIGVYKSVGAKFLKPGETAQFKPNGGFCIDHYEGWYSSRTSASQHWKKKANPNGAHCGNQLVTVKRDKYGNFFFRTE